MSESEPHRYDAVLAAAAPVGTTVYVQTVSPGRVRLYVETGESNDRNYITSRAASLADVDYSSESDTAADAGDLVSRLSLRLHGSTGCLFTHTATP